MFLIKHNKAIRSYLGRFRSARYAINQIRYQRFKWALKSTQKNRQQINIVIGSSGTADKNWISTEQSWLDITNFESWSRHFVPGQIDRILAEHVLEHLSQVETVNALKNIYLFLRPGGYIRVAVPDGNHPSRTYIEQVRPGGTGAGALDHKILYTFTSLQELFISQGFSVSKLEFFDNLKAFHMLKWVREDGMIFRSYEHDERNQGGINNYSSIIIDAKKPSEGYLPK